MSVWQNYLDSVDDSHQMTTSKVHIADLCELAEEAETILELGSHAGISAAALALAAPDARVVSVDLCDTIQQGSRVGYWESLGIENIHPVAGHAGDFLRTAPRFDLVFHDAAHGDAVVGEYLRCAEIGRIVAIHDWEQLSEESQEVVSEKFSSFTTSEDERGRVLFIGVA